MHRLIIFARAQFYSDLISQNVFTTVSVELCSRCVKGQPSGSVAQLTECSHGKREALGSSPGRTTIFSSPVTFGGSVWVRG